MNGQLQIGVLGIMLMGMMLSGCAARPRGDGVPVPMDQVRGSWRLVGMNGRDVPATPPITLTIEPENRVAGSAGVNRYFGVYQSPAAGSLRFFQMGSTRMAGEPEAMRRETEFFTTMERVRSFTLDADVLEMSDAQSPVLIWRRDARPQRR